MERTPLSLPFSLTSLRTHSIFAPSPIVDEEWVVVPSPSQSDSLPGRKRSRLALRDRDLLVAVGSELRITALGERWEISSGMVGSYKVGSTWGAWADG
jgi:nucleoporin NUP82